MTQQENHDDSVNQREGSINASARAWVDDKSKAWILAILVAVNVVATILMFVEWRLAERENRMLEYYVMELDGKLMADGVIKPPNSWSGRKQKEMRK